MSKNFLSYSYMYTEGIFRPVLEVALSDNGLISNPIRALVDSGSDKNLFPALVAESLNIKLDKLNSKTLMGIGGVRIKAYTAKINLHLYKFSFRTNIDFSYEQRIPILGRNGFFNLFKSIKFKEEEKFLDIELKDA